MKERSELFTTPVWRYKYIGPPDILDKLTERVYDCQKTTPSEKVSNQGGYQSPLFEWSEFLPEGQQYINSVLQDLLEGEKLTPRKGLSLDIEYWYNINKKGDSNSAHLHAYTHLIMIWYLTDQERSLLLYNPQSYSRHLMDSIIAKKNLPNDYGIGEQMLMSANKGDILIFPGDVLHGVDVHDKDTDRISISFNLTFKSGGYSLL